MFARVLWNVNVYNLNKYTKPQVKKEREREKEEIMICNFEAPIGAGPLWFFPN